MSLITELLTHPLDPAYSAAAHQREARGEPPSTGLRGPLLLITCIVIGFTLMAAGMALRSAGTSATAAREGLVGQVEAKQSEGDAKADTVAELQRQVADAQSSALAGAAQHDLQSQLTSLSAADGLLAVHGPAVLVSLTDAPGTSADDASAPRAGSGFASGRVNAADVAAVVNALWQSGAEAVSVNGQRLTSRSAIRFAGEAILVDYRPLSSPYVITAIGNPSSLQASFASGGGGAYLKALSDNYRIATSVRTVDDASVPAAAQPDLRAASPPAPAPAPASAPASAPTSAASPGTVASAPAKASASAHPGTATSTRATSGPASAATSTPTSVPTSTARSSR